MSGNQKNIKPYSTTDIQKYLNGELSAPEMHQLEKAALVDPFLADALEGMENDRSSRSETAFQYDLKELDKRLNARVTEKENRGVVPLFRSILHAGWKVAAVLVLLAGLAGTAWYFRQNQTTKRYSKAAKSVQPGPAITDSAVSSIESTAVAAATAHVPTIEKAADKASPPAKTESKEAETEKSGSASAFARPAQAPVASYSPAPSALRLSPIAKTRRTGRERIEFDSLQYRMDTLTIADNYKRTFRASAPPLPGPPLRTILADKAKAAWYFKADKEPYNGSVTGVVTDDKNHPIAGASVSLFNNNDHLNTVTDNNGLFHLKLPPKDSNINITVASVGYQDASVAISTENTTGNIIRLLPQTSSLNEVVVTRYSKKKKITNKDEILKKSGVLSDTISGMVSGMELRKPLMDTTNQIAVPATGWMDYLQWLDINKPTLAVDHTLSGNEIITFKVDSKGHLSAFNIGKSLSPAHDSASIQLIRQGPAWKLRKGKKARATVTITFP
jgi:hypothetical protein